MVVGCGLLVAWLSCCLHCLYIQQNNQTTKPQYYNIDILFVCKMKN